MIVATAERRASARDARVARARDSRASGETTHRTRAHPGRRVEDVSMDATGAFVASCADDGSVKIWNVAVIEDGTRPA